jgi:hypothetical protein
MDFWAALNDLHLRYDGPLPDRQRVIARHGSVRAFGHRRARVMADRFSAEYGRVLGELWRHQRENAYGLDFPTQDRLRDLRFYRRQRIDWDRHAEVLSP